MSSLSLIILLLGLACFFIGRAIREWGKDNKKLKKEWIAVTRYGMMYFCLGKTVIINDKQFVVVARDWDNGRILVESLEKK